MAPKSKALFPSRSVAYPPEAEHDRKKAVTKVRLPKTLGACADRLGELRDAKAQLARALEDLETERKAIEARLIKELPASDSDGIAGRAFRATVVTKRIPQIADWEKLTAYVKKTGAFELFQRRLSEEAVKERWEAKQNVPGVEGFTKKKISLTQK